MAKITAPNRGYNGISAGVVFTDGVGETDNAGAIQYFRRAGYGVSGGPKTKEKFPTAPVTPAPDPYEPEVPAEVQFGTPLRDAAVAPLPTDFLPPTNAGEADPHGPLVVAPGLHAVSPAPIRPGPVAVDDPERQSAEETALAEAVLVNRQPVDEAIADVAAANRAAEQDPEGRPAKRASRADWAAYAISTGLTPEEVEPMTKADLVEKLG